ncbi:hypothetical protein C2857_000569 [Epichloe festucae Fl1]|uniref:Secreted protein n=1 Tax=Epichloe festucae (strain Fl1) TaxID=877507 RepID=A0A7S9KVA0_EPIFF|nr:hypothetical protein C2857_000569 [Epichloe festucae Fl1]
MTILLLVGQGVLPVCAAHAGSRLLSSTSIQGAACVAFDKVQSNMIHNLVDANTLDSSSPENHNSAQSGEGRSKSTEVATAGKRQPLSRRGHVESRLGCFNCKRTRIQGSNATSCAAVPIMLTMSSSRPLLHLFQCSSRVTAISSIHKQLLEKPP